MQDAGQDAKDGDAEGRDASQGREIATEINAIGAIDGFAEAVTRRCARLLDLAEDGAGEGDARWLDLARERATWPALLASLEEALGDTPPMVRLAQVFDLDAVERELIITLWGLSLSPSLARRARSLLGGLIGGLAGARGDGIPAGVVVHAAFPDGHARQQAWHALRPQGTLRQHRLVRMAAGAPRLASVALDPEVGAFLDGVWHAPAGASGAVRGWRMRDGAGWPPADADTAAGTAATVFTVHRPILTRLQALLATSSASDSAALAPHAALIGRAGAGKRTLARAVAMRLDMPLIEVRLGTLDDAEQRADVLARCRRDALLHQALLYVEVDLREDARGPALAGTLAALAAHPGAVVLGVPAEPASPRAASIHAVWPALIALPIPDVRPAVQPALWREILRAYADSPGAGAGAPEDWEGWPMVEPTDEDLEAHACRSGLVVGDLVRAVEAVATRLRADMPGSAIAAALAAALAAHLAHELEPLAERLWPPGFAQATPPEPEEPKEPAWADVAAAVRGGRLEVDAWGASTRTSPRPCPVVVHIAGGTHDRVAAAARFLAHAAGMPLYRADLAYLVHQPGHAASDYLDRLFAAAARSGAMLLLTPAAVLALDQPHTRAAANALGTCLAHADIPVLIHDPRAHPLAEDVALPVAIRSRVEQTISMAGTT